MKRVGTVLADILWLCVLTVCANSFLLVKAHLWSLLLLIPAFLAANILSGMFDSSLTDWRLRICRHGAVCLWQFLACTVISVLYHGVLAFRLLPENWLEPVLSAVVCVCVLAVVFWNGIISVYCTSVQIGIKYRVVGILCGMIPVVNLVVLIRILGRVTGELKTERRKQLVDEKRKDLQVCRTKYPLLLVHGVFFRDSQKFNYWGRIPEELTANGAVIYYGEHQSAASVEDSARELTERIKEIVARTGCEKLNIIAHSKGGLDCRYAIAHLDAAPYIASLTTINTPHRGCLFADYLLEQIPVSVKEKVASTYNRALKKLGDPDPDFLAAVEDLTAAACWEFDAQPQPEGIYCQSVGSVLKKASGGKFPLNFSYHLVKYFDGANDGLVAESAFRWGERYTLVTTKGKRGISHGDMIDLNRENIADFDVREFYVNLVAALKDKGL